MKRNTKATYTIGTIQNIEVKMAPKLGECENCMSESVPVSRVEIIDFGRSFELCRPCEVEFAEEGRTL